jgi:hypothetical protein
MACQPDYPGWLAIFFTTIPSSKGLALASGFKLIFCSGRFPKEGGMSGLSELR